MKNKLLSNVLGLMLIVVISVAGVAVVRLGSMPAETRHAPAGPDAGAIGGIYSGEAVLKFTLGGVYSDTLSTPVPPPVGTPAPANLGQVGLSLFLSQNGNAVNGYIDLEKTLIFSIEHTIQATPVGLVVLPGQPTPAPSTVKTGPHVQGTFDGTTLNVQSEKVSLVISGRPVQRQFRITGSLNPGNANELIGEYRETLWGYNPKPVTMLGTFVMRRPAQTNTFDNGGAVILANADIATTMRGKAVTINVLDNDAGPSGDTLSIASVSLPQNGTASISGAGIIYTPNSTFSGVDTFSYVLSNGKGDSATGSVNVRVIEPIWLPALER